MANITLIDDDKQLLNILSLTLKRGGHHVTTINTPQNALAQLQENKPDLLILDVMMPRISGHELCRQVKADPALADVPVLILTARAQTADRDAALATGADDYLPKPVKSRELLDRVEALLSPQPADDVQHGTVVGILGFRGGVGCTTIAVQLAVALRTLAEQPVALVDLSPAGSQAAVQLRVRAARTWADLPDPAEIDAETLEEILAYHPSGIQLLAAPYSPVAAHLPGADQTVALIRQLRQTHRFIVVDLPKVLNEAARSALGLVDYLFHVVTPEVIAVRQTGYAQQALEDPAYRDARQATILNHATPAEQLPRGVVERALHGRIAVEIGFDEAQQSAIAQGQVVGGSAPLPFAARKLAAALMQGERARARVN